MPFLKFQYGSKIKKLQVSTEELSWSNIIDILTKSFLFSEKEKLKVTYKDQEGDEITLRNDEDLKEACASYMTNDLIRFFVYYSGETKAQPTSPLNGNQKQAKALKIEAQELEDIFTELFACSEVINKLQAKLNTLAQKNSESFEYSVETDYSRVLQYLMKKLNELANQAPKIDLRESYPVISKEPMKIENTMLQYSHIQENPISVSTYEALTKSTLFDKVNELSNKKTTDFDPYKSLMDSAGFRFVMKFENGKARFMPVTKSSLAESQQYQMIGQSTRVTKPVEETVAKPEVVKQNKNDEFGCKILKDNMHDLDDDLPAPYDHKKVQKYEDGMTSQRFEKICK